MFPLLSDRVLGWVLRGAAALTGTLVVVVLAFLIVESVPALRSVGVVRFFTDASWHPAGAVEGAGFNLMPMLLATFAAACGAVLLASPVGLASALFCQFYAPPRLARGYRRLVELLAGIPSVVYGFWGLSVLAPLIRQWQPPGQSLLSGILILALMILPTVALLCESSLRSVPKSYFQGAAALGLSRWPTIYSVALPAARDGIVAAIILATGRAVGETMALLMVTGNLVQTPRSLFDPVRTLTANIALELGYAMDMHRSALFMSGLVLMTMVVVLVGLSEWHRKRGCARG